MGFSPEFCLLVGLSPHPSAITEGAVVVNMWNSVGIYGIAYVLLPDQQDRVSVSQDAASSKA